MDNKTLLITLMVVLICFIVMLAVLAIVFIIALRKRAPVVKVLMPSISKQQQEEPDEAEESEEPPKEIPPQAEQLAMDIPAPAEPEKQEPAPAEKGADEIASAVVPEEIPDSDDSDDDDDEGATIVTESGERVRYDRSLTAKLSKLSNESKEWYTELKNELLSYERIKDRMSWKRESFRLGRVTLARFTVRGKTLCLFFAVEPSGYAGTKYHVEDVSNVAATSDTPTLYRIKSGRRMRYAKEMIAGIMKEIKVYKNPRYEAKDFFVPYEGDMALMQRGLIKRVVTGSTRTFKIEEVDGAAQAESAAAETPATETATIETPENNGNE